MTVILRKFLFRASEESQGKDPSPRLGLRMSGRKFSDHSFFDLGEKRGNTGFFPVRTAARDHSGSDGLIVI